MHGLVVAVLLLICTCAYISHVPRLKAFFLSEKKGVFGAFYKGGRPPTCSARAAGLTRERRTPVQRPS